MSRFCISILILMLMITLTGCNMNHITTVYIDVEYEYPSNSVYRVTDYYVNRHNELVIDGYFVHGGWVDTLTFIVDSRSSREVYTFKIETYTRRNQSRSFIIRLGSYTSGTVRLSVY